MSSSVRPSLKYAFSASGLRFANGRTRSIDSPPRAATAVAGAGRAGARLRAGGRMRARCDPASNLIDLVAHVPRRLNSPIAIFLETPLDQSAERPGQVAPAGANRRRRIAEDRGQQGGRTSSLKRPRAGRGLVKEYSKREHVGTRVQLPAFDLFGRHVRQGPHHHAVAGAHGGLVLGAAGPRRIVRFGEPEVQHLHAPVGRHHHVARLQIPVHDALVVRGGEGLCEGDRQLQQFRSRQSLRRAAADPAARLQPAPSSGNARRSRRPARRNRS